MHHAEGDFETRSEAGFVWSEDGNKWAALPGASAGRKGLQVVQAAVYAEHPTTDVLTFSYALPPLMVTRRWQPGMPNPQDLFDHLARGGTFQAHNAMFERLIWHHVCVRKYGWPPLPPMQIRCTMARAHVHALPGALGDLSDVLNLPTPKDKEGTRLLKKFSIPRDPTKKDARRWVSPKDEPAEFEALCSYCDTDIAAEHGVHERIPEMSAAELYFWLIDQEINWHGIAVDRPFVRDCISILDQALVRYGEECRAICGFGPSQVQALQGWLAAQGVYMDSLDAETVDIALERMVPHPPGGQYNARRVLEIRQLAGSASVKKLYAIDLTASSDDRIRNLIIHHGARTGRPTGAGAQPLNMPRGGPEIKWCACNRPFNPKQPFCPWCGVRASEKKKKWSFEAVEHAREIIATRSLDAVEMFFGDALLTISGCLRSMFIAAEGHDLIASDYSAIEAVVLAMLAGEEWRIQAFRENKPIYLLGASKITGIPLEVYEAYYAENGEHHPDRQNIGKVSELACGFGGWINSYKAFGSTESDENIRRQILAWRRASPAIVEYWGGQFRGAAWEPNTRQEYYGVEGTACLALLYPGQAFDYRGVKFQTRELSTGRGLIITLLSGRELTYHNAMLYPATSQYARPGEYKIVYMTHNSNPKYGPLGWTPMNTYGGRLTENIVQATAHDILRYAIINLWRAGYRTVLHVYDEIVAEIAQDFGSLEAFEAIMATMPPWASDWPIRAAGGWRGRRYRKA